MNLDLRRELEVLYRTYHRRRFLDFDPLGLLRTDLEAGDFELVSFVSAGLSYGRVEQIRKSLRELWIRLEVLGLGPGGEGLYNYLVNRSKNVKSREIEKTLGAWCHRFNDSRDMSALFLVLARILMERGSLGQVYLELESTEPTSRLEAFVRSLRSYATVGELKRVSWFMCLPSEGSSCKRLLMWLRWMLRHDEIDPGTWSLNHQFRERGLGPAFAMMPLDTHVHRWARERGLVSRKSAGWKSVEELTENLRRLEPDDPAKYDFSICHSGMSAFRNFQSTGDAV